jgi:hypothetical protein
MSHVNIGRNGKKNWLVAGIMRAATRRVVAPVFNKGPEGLIERANIPKVRRNKYCPSYNDHLYALNFLRVTMGENDTSTDATDEAGDCLARSFDRNLWTRYL